MARINLLPWREELRKQKQREFAFTLAGAAILGALLVLLAHMQVQGMIESQSARNRFLEEEIVKLDNRIAKIRDLESTKAKLLARMNVIQQLQSSRPLSVHLLDDIVRTLPEGVYLEKLAQEGNNLTFFGVAQSNARVSAYMRNIDGSVWLSKPTLDVIQTETEKRRRIAKVNLRATQNPDPEPEQVAEVTP
jgi:type IV pilus assembly protein PilN